MPVEKDINLDKPLTNEDISALEEEAEHLEKLAQEAQEDAKKAKEFQKEEESMLNDAVKKIEQLEKEAEKAEKAKNKIGKSIKEVNQLASHRGGLAGMGGEDPFSTQAGMGGMIPGAGDISGGRTGFGTGQESSAMGGLSQATSMREAQMLEADKKHKEDIKKLKEAEKLAKKERMENAKRIAENKASVMKVQKGFGEAMSGMNNPMAFGMGKLKGMVGKAGIYGLIAVIAISMAEQVFEEVKKLYGPGGPYDVRKQMLDRDREMLEMDNILARRSGRVFFTSDTELRQGAPEYSNTERLRDRAVRFQALHLGE